MIGSLGAIKNPEEVDCMHVMRVSAKYCTRLVKNKKKFM